MLAIGFTSSSLSFINLIASSEDFKSLIKNPTNSKDDQLNALRKISEQYKLNDLLTKFLKKVYE